MNEQFIRTSYLLGEDNLNKLFTKTVAIFGIGGVGGYVLEALARAGVSSFVLIDNDTVALSNINRQIIATYDSINKAKVDVAKQRILSINPNANVEVHKTFYLPENASDFDFTKYDYVVDAIDTITAKLDIITKCKELNVPIISAMGAGNKLDPTKFVVTDIYKTSMDPLAKVMRHELRKREIKDLKVVYSLEEAITPTVINKDPITNKVTPGSISYVPSVCGLIIASEVIKDLIK